MTQRNYKITDKEKAALSVTRLFRALLADELEEALVRGRARGAQYGKGMTVTPAESYSSEFMILLSGRIQGVREQKNGIVDFVQLFIPGEVCGLDIACSSTRRYPYRLVALDDTDLVFIDYNGIFSGKVSREAEQKLREGVTQTLATESLRRLHKIDVLYRRALRDRVCVYLMNICTLSGSKNVELNMDREQFAQYLGVNRSALSHELALMRRDGLIDFRKGSIKVLKEL